MFYSLIMINSFNEDFNKVTFIANHIQIIAADVDKINHDEDENFDEDGPEIIIYVSVVFMLAWCSKFKNAKFFKESKWRNSASSMTS